MKTCTSARRVARGHATDPLTVVAQVIDGAMTDGTTPQSLGPETHGGPDAPSDPGSAECAAQTPRSDRYVFAATYEADGIDVYLRPIDGHPAEELAGFVAPEAWSCIGVASGAWASSYEGDPSRATMTEVDRRRVRLLLAVERSGASISIFRDAGAPPSIQRHTVAGAERAGALDDLLRRALGIPTAAPGSTLEYFAMRWIDDIFTKAVAGQLESATWPAIAALHQVHHFAADPGDAQLTRWAIDHLVRAGEIMADARPWSAVLAATIDRYETDRDEAHRDKTEPDAHFDAVRPTGVHDPVAVAAGVGQGGGQPDEPDKPDQRRLLEQLRWMDTGMFSRTVMGRYPPIEDLLLDLNAMLDADPYRHLVDTIEAWGLLR